MQIEKGSHGDPGKWNDLRARDADRRGKQEQLVDLALSVAAKRVPVVAATGSQSLAETGETDGTRGESGRRRTADCHALLHAATAARPCRVLPGDHAEDQRFAMDGRIAFPGGRR